MDLRVISSPAARLRGAARNLTDLRQALGHEARRLDAPTTQRLRLDLVGAEADVLIFDEAIARGDAPWIGADVRWRLTPLPLASTDELLLLRFQRAAAKAAAAE